MPHQKSSHVHPHLSAKALQRQLFLLKDQIVLQAAVALLLECVRYPLHPPAGSVGYSAEHFSATSVRLLCVVTATSQWAGVGKNSHTLTNTTDIRTGFTRRKTVLLWRIGGSSVGPRTARDDEPLGVKRCGPHSSASTGSCVEGGGFTSGGSSALTDNCFHVRSGSHPTAPGMPSHCRPQKTT